MNKKDALKKFFDCVQRDDSAGAFAALAFVPIETLNQQDENGCDMLIRAVSDGNSCAVEALLQDGRCDWSHEEKLHGKRALEIAQTYPPDSRICKAFQNNKKPNFIYRNSRIIPCADIYEQILDGRLPADRGCFDLLDLQFSMELFLAGRIHKENFENWISGKKNAGSSFDTASR